MASKKCSALSGAVLAAALLVAGCASPDPEPGFAAAGARNTGTFPNLNVPPAVAATQFDPYSLSQHNTAIQTAVQAQQAEGAVAAASISPEEAERLRRLGATHGQDALNAIEAR